MRRTCLRRRGGKQSSRTLSERDSEAQLSPIELSVYFLIRVPSSSQTEDRTQPYYSADTCSQHQLKTSAANRVENFEFSKKLLLRNSMFHNLPHNHCRLRVPTLYRFVIPQQNRYTLNWYQTCFGDNDRDIFRSRNVVQETER